VQFFAAPAIGCFEIFVHGSFSVKHFVFGRAIGGPLKRHRRSSGRVK
jgi:hypothetical protein